MSGKENIDKYIEARKIISELYDITDWAADKPDAMYISGAGYL